MNELTIKLVNGAWQNTDQPHVTHVIVRLQLISGFVTRNTIYGARWVPCHQGMARPQAAGEGDGLQMRALAANILKKQSRTVDNG
jgi:hypothetical protein